METKYSKESALNTFNYFFDGFDTIQSIDIDSNVYKDLVTDRIGVIPEEIWNNSFITNPDILSRYLFEMYSVFGNTKTIFLFYEEEYVICSLIDNLTSWFAIKTDKNYTRLNDLSSELIISKINDIEAHNMEKSNQMFEVAKKIYGEDHVELYTSRDPEAIFFASSFIARHYLVIHIPEVWIEEKHGLKVKLKDFYLSIPFFVGGELVSTVSGMRSSYEYNQFRIGYNHSHLSSFESLFSTHHDFCQGDGILPLAFNTLRNEFNDENIHNLFYTLKIYLEWEDHEGGPFSRIKDKFLNPTSGSRNMTDSELLSHIRLGEIPIRYNIEENNVKLYIEESDILSVSSESQDSVYSATPNGNIYKNNRLTEMPSNLYHSSECIYFKGSKVPCVIYSDLNDYNFSDHMEKNWFKRGSSLPNTNTVITVLNSIKHILSKKLIPRYDIKSYEQKYKIPKELIGLEKISRLSENNSI